MDNDLCHSLNLGVILVKGNLWAGTLKSLLDVQSSRLSRTINSLRSEQKGY